MTGSSPLAPGPGAFEQWLARHMRLVLVTVIAAGLAIRIAEIRGMYLGSDEAVHFQLVNVSSVTEVYRATLTNAHPPFFFFLLHFWLLIGHSEFLLRLLPVIFGTALLPVAYRWAADLFDERAAFFTLVVLAFSPALVFLSAELRGYTLLVLLMASSLLLLERSLGRRSVLSMAGSWVLLSLAILTHYSAIWFAAAAFAYVLVRILTEKPPPRLVVAWLAFQGGTATLCLFLYFSHLAALRGSALERAVMNRADYFDPRQDGALAYLTRQTGAFFQWLLGSPGAGIVGFAVFVLGIALLVARQRAAALLFGLPFLFGAAAGLAGFYPFGGTRHSAYLLFFAAAAIAFAAGVTGRRLWPAVPLAILLAVYSFWNLSLRERNLPQMTAAIQAIRQNAPPGSLLFTDLHTGLILSYYLGGSDFFRENPTRTHFWKSSAGGYRLIGSRVWVFNAEKFAAELRQFIDTFQPAPEQPIWIVHIGPELDPALLLARIDPSAPRSHPLHFGQIVVVEARRR